MDLRVEYDHKGQSLKSGGGEPTKVECNYIYPNVIKFCQMLLHLQNCDPLSPNGGKCNYIQM